MRSLARRPRRLRFAWRSCGRCGCALRCVRRLPLRHWARAVALGLRRLASVARPVQSGSSRHPGPEPLRPRWLVPSPGPGAISAALARPVPRARSRIGDRPLLRWALGLRVFGPYFALGRDLATFALGAVSMAGRPLLRGTGAPRLARPVPRARSLDLALRQRKDETCPFTLGAWSLQGFGPLPALIPPDPSRAW